MDAQLIAFLARQRYLADVKSGQARYNQQTSIAVQSSVTRAGLAAALISL